MLNNDLYSKEMKAVLRYNMFSAQTISNILNNIRYDDKIRHNFMFM